MEIKNIHGVSLKGDKRGEVPGIIKLAIVVAIIYFGFAIGVPKFKEYRADKDKANIAKMTEVLQESFSDANIQGFVPHGKGGAESTYSFKDLMYRGSGGNGDALSSFVKTNLGSDFPDELITTKEDITIRIVGNKNFFEFYLYAGYSENNDELVNSIMVEDRQLAHFYSPSSRGVADPDGCNYKFYDAEKEGEESADVTE